MSDDNLWGQGETEETFAAAPPRADRRLGADDLLAQHRAALAAGRTLEATLAVARHAGRSGDPAPLRAWLAERAPARDEAEAEAAAEAFVRMSSHSLFGRQPERARAALPPAALTALLCGAEPVTVLRQAAILCDQYGVPCLAADFIDAVVALRPGWSPPLFNRALIKMSLGDFFAARGDIKALRDAGDGDGELLHQYFNHLAGDWTFFPVVDQLASNEADEITSGFVLPAELGEVFDEQAQLLAGLRRRLEELAAERNVAPSFLPPEVAFPGEPTAAESTGIPDLLSAARLVWARMCALSWVTGHDLLVRPDTRTLDDRVGVLYRWTGDALRIAQAVADGADPGPGESPTWARIPLTAYHTAFSGMKLVPLFEELAGLAGWLAGAPSDDDDDDENDTDDEDDDEDGHPEND